MRIPKGESLRVCHKYKRGGCFNCFRYGPKTRNKRVRTTTRWLSSFRQLEKLLIAFNLLWNFYTAFNEFQFDPWMKWSLYYLRVLINNDYGRSILNLSTAIWEKYVLYWTNMLVSLNTVNTLFNQRLKLAISLVSRFLTFCKSMRWNIT